jgi:integrase/recombinase XerD
MPTKLSTTVDNIQLVLNLANGEAITAFHAHITSNDLSVHNVNNNLKASIAFANYLGPDIYFFDISNKQQVLSFLDSNRISLEDDTDIKWITSWNHYLNRLRLFFRWFLNRYLRSN